MRIIVKGGAWKNTEDEILKAAVMKYGLNQWSRVASLMNRKSAKQCKSRWYEWLDPNIKKTEWTREEDEKLLHVIKLFPMQWRTIAPVVGRTPVQCLDRYDKLASMFEKGEAYDPRDDARKLRLGEIDPNPESKPARPDAVDMDEDEKEMLAEARARLANTRGKKAKRKARERQMDEARRLAQLQKKRELKAAGIELAPKRTRKRDIQYNKEIPFEREPVAGPYDLSKERESTKAIRDEFRPTTIIEMEGMRRKEIEIALRKEDAKRERSGDEGNISSIIPKMLKTNAVNSTRKKGKMMLPTPQITDSNLSDMVKMERVGLSYENGYNDESVKGLVHNHSIQPLLLRTPRSMNLNETNTMLNDAKTVKAMTTTAYLEKEDVKKPLNVTSCHFGGLMPYRRISHTTRATMSPQSPFRGAHNNPKTTTNIITDQYNGESTTPITTPSVCDTLGINEYALLRKDSISEKINTIDLGFANLPKPNNGVWIVLPLPTVDENKSLTHSKVHVECKTNRLNMQKKIYSGLRGKKSLHVVVRRDLSTPLVSDNESIASVSRNSRAETLVAKELECTIFSSCDLNNKNGQKNLLPSKNKKSCKVLSYKSIGPMRHASELLYLAAEKLRIEWKRDIVKPEEYLNIWKNNLENSFCITRQGPYYNDYYKSNIKRENKIALLTCGQQTRNKKSHTNFEMYFSHLQALQSQISQEKDLKKWDACIIPNSIDDIKRLVKDQKDWEDELQASYKSLQGIVQNMPNH